MASFVRFNSFLEAAFEKKHNLGSDSFVIFLCAAANAPSASSHTQLSDVTQISYTNLSSRALTITSSSQSSGTYKWVLQDITLSASGGAVAAFRYVGIYNDTATNDEVVGYYDYSSDLTLQNGESLAIDFDGTNGVFTVG